MRTTLLLWLLMQALAGNAFEVVVVSDPDNTIHQRFVASFSQQLQQDWPEARLQQRATTATTPWPEQGFMVVNVGSQSTSLPSSVPILYSLISAHRFQTLPPTTAPHSALYIDQPLDRTVALIQRALPQYDHIGALLGPDSSRYAVPLEQYTAAASLTLSTEQLSAADTDIYPPLQRLLTRANAILLLADAAVVNRTNAKTLIMASYRHKVPLVAYSQALVKAGALLAVYSTPEQQGSETAQMVVTQRSQRTLPPPRHPQQFSVGVNYQLARLLELSIESSDNLTHYLQQREHQP